MFQGCKLLGSILEPNGKLGNVIVDENGRTNFKFYLPDLEVYNFTYITYIFNNLRHNMINFHFKMILGR